MASCTSIHGSPIGAFKHDLRERDVFRNEDIDLSKSDLNSALSPSDHGRTARECMDYYDRLLKNVYHREGGTVTTAEWSIQVPEDLDPALEEKFFKCTYEFLNHYHFGGDDKRCLLAMIHRDEIGQPHMHYIFTFPEIENEKYVDLKDKIKSGVMQIQERFDIRFTKEQLQDCYSAIKRYEARSDKARERETIQEIGRVLNLKRDDARWCFIRMRRLESEKYKKKLLPKDDFLDKDSFEGFHPAFQKWMDNHDLKCTVYRGGGGINLTIEQLKDITRQTGVTLDRGLSVDKISHLINENSRLKERIAALEHVAPQEHTWGDNVWSREETLWER